MNIIRLTTRIYPDISGPGIFALKLAENVSNQNYKIFNISCKPKIIDSRIKRVNSNFFIHFLPITAPSDDDKIFKKIYFSLKFVLYSLRLIIKLHHQYRIDLIHCDNPSITGVIATIINRIFKIPFIYTQHGLESPYKIEHLLELRLIYQFSTYYTVISRNMKKYFEQNRINTEKILWIPNGIELDKFYHVQDKNEKQKLLDNLKISSHIKVEDFIIIYVGNMNLKQKVNGMIDFFNSYRLFLSRLSEIDRKRTKLLYIGDGQFKKLLEKEIKRFKLEKNVFLLGQRRGIENFYAISDLCALTSYIEGFPTVLLEAIASEVPCLSTDVGEVQAILNEDSIVPAGDIDAIAMKLQIFYNDRNFLEKNLMAAKEKIKKFDWSIIAKKIKKIYLKTLRGDRIYT